MLKWFAYWVVTLVLVMVAPGTERRAQPNIIFLFANARHAETLGALENSAIKILNLDRLVQAGRASYLKNDPDELLNLSGNPRQPDRIEHLQGQAHVPQRDLRGSPQLTSGHPESAHGVLPVAELLPARQYAKGSL